MQRSGSGLLKVQTLGPDQNLLGPGELGPDPRAGPQRSAFLGVDNDGYVRFSPYVIRIRDAADDINVSQHPNPRA